MEAVRAMAEGVAAAKAAAKKLARSRKVEKKAAKQEETRIRQERILTRLCRKSLMTDSEADGIRKLLALGHTPVLGAFDFYLQKASDDSSGDFVLANQLKVLLTEARGDDTLKGALASSTKVKAVNAAKAIMASNKINSFKAMVSRRPGTSGILELQQSSHDQGEQDSLLLRSPRSPMNPKLSTAIKKAKLLASALRCQTCNSNPCTCAFFKGKIVVSSGSHFPKCDRLGRCDPYCIVKYGSTTLLTTQVQRITYEPVWDESFEITIRKMHECEDLVVEIFDRNEKLKFSDTSIMGGRMYDEYIGSVFISAAELTNLLKDTKNIKDESNITRPLFNNHVVTGHDKDSSTLTLVVIPLHLTANSFKGKVIVSSGSHFPKCDLFGKCDPYCIVTYGSTVLHTTKTCLMTYNPVWNEEIEILVDNLDQCEELTLEVFDHDHADAHDLIGSVVIPSTDVKVLLLKSQDDASSTHMIRNNKVIVGFDTHQSMLTLKVEPEILENIKIEKTIRVPENVQNNKSAISGSFVSRFSSINPKHLSSSPHSIDHSSPQKLETKLEIVRLQAYACLIPSLDRPYELPALRYDKLGRPITQGWAYKKHTEVRKGLFSFSNLSLLATKKSLEMQLDLKKEERAANTDMILRWNRLGSPLVQDTFRRAS